MGLHRAVDLGTGRQHRGATRMSADLWLRRAEMAEDEEIAGVYQESHDDYVRLLTAAHDALDKYGPIRGAVVLASGLLAEPDWDRMMVSSVLGVALIEAARAGDAAVSTDG